MIVKTMIDADIKIIVIALNSDKIEFLFDIELYGDCII